MTTKPRTSEACAHCGQGLARGGRPTKDDRPRYCMKTACQRAKQRHYRRALRESDDSLAVVVERRPCSGCGDAMEHRPGRITDSPLGRWCPKRGCQRDKRTKIALADRITHGTFDRADEMMVNEMFWTASRLPRHECWECGCPDGVVGFPHPTIEGGSCKTLGGMPARGDDVRELWPDRFPPT